LPRYFANNELPAGVFNLVSRSYGIGGILIFIPQIAFLFLFISLLEESGYMVEWSS
jgi:ferrous iron transport protein B